MGDDQVIPVEEYLESLVEKHIPADKRAGFFFGKLMTIDYGVTAEELFSPSRPRGTLRAYFHHHASDDLLANVGEQDLTAHVNFSTIQSAGESVGMKTEMFSTQSQFLTRILEKASKDDSLGELVSPKSDGGGSEDGWTPARRASFKPSRIRNIWAAPFACWCNHGRALCCSKASLDKSWWVDGEIKHPAFQKEAQIMKERGKKAEIKSRVAANPVISSGTWESVTKAFIDGGKTSFRRGCTWYPPCILWAGHGMANQQGTLPEVLMFLNEGTGPR